VAVQELFRTEILNSFLHAQALPNPSIPDRAVNISQGFASFFSADTIVQNMLTYIFSPIFFLLLVAFTAWLVYRWIQRYDTKIKDEITRGQQLLLFKAKQLGLTNYQFKILKGITDILHLEKPSQIMDDPHLFERSIHTFLKFASGMGEKRDSIESISKDLIITYEKIYHPADIKKPLSSLKDLEINSLLSISTEDEFHFIGKIRSLEKENFRLQAFLTVDESHNLKTGLGLSIVFWRAGDAEYECSSVIVGTEGVLVEIMATGEFQRGQTVPHPLVDIVLPCTVTPPASVPQESEIQADIFKLNESEAIIRSREKLSHEHPYTLIFSLADFEVRTEMQALRERYIADRHVFYINVKFVKISDAAKTVISTFITEHLFE